MVNAFDKFKRSIEAKRASIKYDGIPFSVVIDKAKSNDKDALYYLILRNLKPIAKSFYRFYATTQYGASKSDVNEESHDIFNNFIVKLYHLTKQKMGPFFSFNPDKFEEHDDDFLFNKFGYYMYRYFQSVVQKLLDSAPSEEIVTSSLDSHDTEGNVDEFMDTVADHRNYDEKDPLEGQEGFIKYLDSIDPKYAQIVYLLSKNYTASDIAEKFNFDSPSNIYYYITKLGKLYSNYLALKAGN
jgi:hypothetical protein